MDASPNTNPNATLQHAVHEILDLYGRLRQAPPMHEKTALLKQARDRAGALAEALQVIAGSAQSHALDRDTLRTLKEMAPLMEQILVQEREYRRAAAGNATEESCASTGDTP